MALQGIEVGMRFDPPQIRVVTATRPVWIKGKGLPKKGIQVIREGDRVTLHTDNGVEWYFYYKGVKVASLISTCG